MPSVDDNVRLWRPRGATGLVCIAGTTSHYAVDPNGEIVIGLVTDGAMLARRGRRRHVVAAGDVCVWDASDRHDGTAHGASTWSARLIVVEPPTVDELVDDGLVGVRDGLARQQPVIRDSALARRFAAFHHALSEPMMSLAIDEAIVALAASVGVPRPPTRNELRDEPAVRRACELLVDESHRNVTLRELAAVAGTSRHRLSRLFQAAYGLPPHRLQIAARISHARRLLERGVPVSQVAHQVGFVDQSHFHRHFRRTLGITPGRYAALARSNVQDARRAAP